MGLRVSRVPRTVIFMKEFSTVCIYGAVIKEESLMSNNVNPISQLFPKLGIDNDILEMMY